MEGTLKRGAAFLWGRALMGMLKGQTVFRGNSERRVSLFEVGLLTCLEGLRKEHHEEVGLWREH